jgi:FkbM family methyltransferase
VTDPSDVRRVLLTLSCTDADHLPKVEGAGEVFEQDGVPVQRMFNGVLVEEGRYAGSWMTEIIRSSRGHHEPQEEVVFDAIIRRLQRDAAPSPRMIEFGSFWSYYSLWFGRSLPGATMFGLEPDPSNLQVGVRNAELNGLRDQIEFVHGAIGDRPGEDLVFDNESDDGTTSVTQYDLDAILDRQDWDHVDLVLVDVQGAETVLLERARETLAARRIRFLMVSTHHHLISGDPLTHQKALKLLTEVGGHIIAEHSVDESFSGDGLIAVSFDPRDADLTVPISFARARDSLFGELEWDLAAAQNQTAALAAEIERIHATRIWRATKRARSAYSSVRRGRS